MYIHSDGLNRFRRRLLWKSLAVFTTDSIRWMLCAVWGVLWHQYFNALVTDSSKKNLASYNHSTQRDLNLSLLIAPFSTTAPAYWYLTCLQRREVWQEGQLIWLSPHVQLWWWYPRFALNMQLLWRCVGGRGSVFHSFCWSYRPGRTDGRRVGTSVARTDIHERVKEEPRILFKISGWN